MMIPVGQIILRNVLAAGSLAALTAHAPALQIQYRTAGADLYRVGTAAPTRILYTGTQLLSEQRTGATVRFVAQTDCTRTDETGTTTEHAQFVQELL